MDIKISIPEDFISEYKKDKFDETFYRVIADLIHLQYTNILSGNYELETLQMLSKAFGNSEVIERE